MANFYDDFQKLHKFIKILILMKQSSPFISNKDYLNMDFHGKGGFYYETQCAKG
jgi:hypothetical protein